MDLRFDDDAIPLSPHEQQRRERLRQYDYIIPSSFQQPHTSRYTFVGDPAIKPTLEKCPSVTHFHQYTVPHAERVISLDTPSTSTASTLWQDVITEASLACIPERLMRNGHERVLSDMDDMTSDTPTPTTPETHDIYQRKNDTVFSFMCNVNHRTSSPTFPHIDDTPTPREQQQQDNDHLKVPNGPSPRISTRTLQQPLRVTTSTPRVVAPTPTPRLIPRSTPRIGSMPTPRVSHFPLIDDTEVKPHPVTRVDSFPLESPAQITNRPLLHVSIPTTVLEPVTPTATATTTTTTTPTTTSSTSTLPPRPTPRVASIRSSPRLVPIDVKAPPTTPLMSPTYRAVATSSSSGYRSPYVAVETERDVQGLQKYLDTPHRPEMEDEIKTLPPDHALNESIEPWTNTEPILSSSTVYYRKLEEQKDEKQREMIHSDSMVSLSDLARSSSSSNLFMFEASCAICLSSRCDCILLPCSHSFHASCILSWVDSTHGRQFSCPLCRQSIEQLIPISRSSPTHRPTHSRRASSIIPDTNQPVEMRHHDDCDIPTISKRHPKIDTIVTSHSSAYDELLHRFTQSWERYYYQGDARDKNEDDDGGEADVILKKGTQIVLDDHEAEQLISTTDTQEYTSQEQTPTQSQSQVVPSTSSRELLYDDLLPDVFYISAELPEISDQPTTHPTTATLYIPFSTIMSQHLHIHTEQPIQPQVVTWRSPFSQSLTQLIHAIHNDQRDRETQSSTSTTSSLLTLGTSPLYAGAIAGLACSLSSIIFGSSAARAASATTAARASLANVSSLGRQWATALQTMRTTIPSVAIYFLSYETMKKILVHDGEQPTSLQYMAAATTAGAISNFRHLRTHPTIPLRFGAQFAFFEQIKNQMIRAQDGQPLYASQVLAAAAAGGLVAYSLEHPIANAWTSWQQRHDPKPMPAPAPRAVLSSLPMQLMRSLPTCAITAVTFEMAHRYMQKNGHNTSIQIQRQSSPPPKPDTSETESKPDSVSSMWFGDLTM